MGLLEKRNPGATRESVAAWAVGGGVAGFMIGGAIWLVMWSCADMSGWAVLVFAPGMAAGAALVCGAAEWQLPPDEDEAADDKSPDGSKVRFDN